MSNSVEEFMKKTKPKSKLKRFENEIYELLDNGYSIKQIVDFLAQNGVKVTPQGLGKFIIKNVKIDGEKESEKKETRVEKKQTQSERERADFLIKKLGG